MGSYEAFLESKIKRHPACGFDTGPREWPHLFDFQKAIVMWALRRGRAAIFASTGLGKSRMQITWAHEVVAHTGGRVLILAPLAVSHQTVREAKACGIEIEYVRDSEAFAASTCAIGITNYERLDKFEGVPLAGVVLDESGILKSFAGSTKERIIARFRGTPYKLACTATPAPNDHVELGNHAEFLDVLTSHEMLARWFINDTSLFGNYRLKGHAVIPYWDWVSSWAMCVNLPSDLGFVDGALILPKLNVHEHTVDRDGMLFREPDMNATKVHRERRRTAGARGQHVANLVNGEPNEQWLIWGDTDYDCDAIRDLVPGLVEVHGSDSPESKEENLLAFADGRVRALLTKIKVAGFGMNFQSCARMAFLGATFSYEAWHQGIRRSWRYGQKREVDVHVAMATTERRVFEIMREKERGHIEMQRGMFASTRRAQSKEDDCAKAYVPTHEGRLPSWL